ncbi:ParA family protein [Kitasatospora sp. NRRL B-11411]|jgi:chromosome partitioning protein|uniref:ParA family protein n=1 Tax=Kitasatospora sp. NRRL B-11411 TaxID=1463822 RepID=UPI0004C322BF|nr:ParA family protein [Kitasatospora sp. NRRL B-11411]MDR3082842.1 ParA family protein [Streptomyces sp.]
MSTDTSADGRDKVVTKLPATLRRELKIRAATAGVDIQDAVTVGIRMWLDASEPLSPIDTSSSSSFSTYVPSDLYKTFRVTCLQREVPYNQGLAQAIRLWLDANPRPRPVRLPTGPQRIVVANQKGGVGKTAISSGVAQALAEAGHRVLIVDFDPQSHLTLQLGISPLPIKGDSLAKNMTGERSSDLRELLVEVPGDAFEGRLLVLPACTDAFLLDAKLVTSRDVRVKETALEKALAAVEREFDVVIVDCPPSLGYAMDNALYYARTREGEPRGRSGLLIPVQAEDSSADAYILLREQIESLCDDLDADIHDFGFVVNLYDPRKGFVVTSALEQWKAIEEPAVIAVVNDLKDQREAVRVKKPLLSHAPDSEQADVMREIARRITA